MMEIHEMWRSKREKLINFLKWFNSFSDFDCKKETKHLSIELTTWLKKAVCTPKATPQIWLMADAVAAIEVTGNSQNPMNKKWKLAFTRFSLSLARRERLVVVVDRQKRRSQKVGKNLILKNCHSVSIWKFQGYQLPFPDVCFPRSFLCISRFASPRLFHLRVLIFTMADSLPGDLIVWQDAPPADK